MSYIKAGWLKDWLALAMFCLVACWSSGFAQDTAAQGTASQKTSATQVIVQDQASPGAPQKLGQEQPVSHYAGLTLQQVEEFLLNAKGGQSGSELEI